MLNLKKSIETKKNEIIEAYTEYPLDFNKILNLECELEDMKENRDHLNHIGFKLGFVEAIDIPMNKFKEMVEKAFAETAKEEVVEEEKEPVDEEEKEPVDEKEQVEETPTK